MTASETGCISAHYQNMVIEGEEVRAFATPADDKRSAISWAGKKKSNELVAECILNHSLVKSSYEK